MSDDEDNFAWICEDENESHRRELGYGGFAEVHEVTCQQYEPFTNYVDGEYCDQYGKYCYDSSRRY